MSNLFLNTLVCDALCVPHPGGLFASSKNPNRHATTYALKQESGSLKTGYTDAMLYLSAADSKAVRVGMLATFSDSTPG